MTAPSPAHLDGASGLKAADSATDALVARLRAQAWIDDPTVGWCRPDEFERQSLVWPLHGWESVEPRNSFASADRDIGEYVFRRAAGDPAEVPVAVVWDKSQEDARARVYYNKSHFGLTEPRRPLVAPALLEWPSDLKRYFDAVTSGDRAKLESVVHPDAIFHSPVGEVGRDVFVAAFSGPQGGVPLQFNTITGTEGEYAVEFTSWRRPPHGGLGVYTFRDGMIVGARVYEGPSYR